MITVEERRTVVHQKITEIEGALAELERKARRDENVFLILSVLTFLLIISEHFGLAIATFVAVMFFSPTMRDDELRRLQSDRNEWSARGHELTLLSS